MPRRNTRDAIIEAADRLFYQQGFEQTTFDDLADRVGIVRGNFYYHFKFKEDILDAVIERRMKNTRHMLEDWEAEGSCPAERIKRFIQMLIPDPNRIEKYGYPVGALCVESVKPSQKARECASELFAFFRQWIASQFEQLGFGGESDAMALRLLVHSQGVASLADALQDKTITGCEIKQMHDRLKLQIEGLLRNGN